MSRRGRAADIIWLDEADARRLAGSAPPDLRRGGNLVEGRLTDGRTAVIAELDVRWGRLL